MNRRTLMGFIRKELTQTLRDPRMRVLLFVMPTVQLALFGVAISSEVKNVRLAAIFDSRDTVLRDIYERSIASGWFIPAKSEGESDPYELIRTNQADAVLVPPPGGFTRELGRRKAPLQLLINATNVTKAQSIESYINSIVKTTVADDLKPAHVTTSTSTSPSTGVSASTGTSTGVGAGKSSSAGTEAARTETRTETGTATTAVSSDQQQPPITIDTRVLFNPDLNTAWFMVPGTMCMVMIITTMVMSNLAIVREKEMGTFEMLISAPVSTSEVILGKTIPYVVLGMFNFPLLVAVATFIFHVPLRGSVGLLFLAALTFIFTSVAMGTLVSTFCQNQQQATLGGFLVIFPMIMFSGLMFPVENMPSSVRWLALIDPVAHFMGLVRNIMLKGGGADYVFYHIGALLLIAVVTVIVSFKRFHTTLQ